jgi:hypothetical protein
MARVFVANKGQEGGTGKEVKEGKFSGVTCHRLYFHIELLLSCQGQSVLALASKSFAGLHTPPMVYNTVSTQSARGCLYSTRRGVNKNKDPRRMPPPQQLQRWCEEVLYSLLLQRG